LLELVGKRHKREVYRIEHQLDRHKHGNNISPVQKTGDAESKKHSAEE
jgi:hypothetical protein